MKKILLFSAFLFAAVSSVAQVRMRDVFAQLPDSILPLMTRNNRLDCIDFIENGMEARVKNKFNDQVVLEALTEDFLLIRTSESSTVEMKLMPLGSDTLICVNRTYLGPTEDSEVKLYNTNWCFVRNVQRPEVSEFLKTVDSICPWTPEMADTMDMICGDATYLPLIKASLSAESSEIQWVLQSNEFSKEIKKVADRYLQPVTRKP
jgi:hypothetical protein